MRISTNTSREAKMTGLSRGRRLDRSRLADAFKTADSVLSEIDSRVLFGLFHSPFPDVAGDYLKSHGGAMEIHIMQEPSKNQERDSLSKLPLELFELVFAKLSAYELDAARFTCRSRSSYPSLHSPVVALCESCNMSRQHLLPRRTSNFWSLSTRRNVDSISKQPGTSRSWQAPVF